MNHSQLGNHRIITGAATGLALFITLAVGGCALDDGDYYGPDDLGDDLGEDLGEEADDAEVAKAIPPYPTGAPYFCFGVASGNGFQAVVTYDWTTIHPAIMRAWEHIYIPASGWDFTGRVTLAKSQPGPNLTTWEYTANTLDIQCALDVSNDRRYLSFYNCTNGAWQACWQ